MHAAFTVKLNVTKKYVMKWLLFRNTSGGEVYWSYTVQYQCIL